MAQESRVEGDGDMESFASKVRIQRLGEASLLVPYVVGRRRVGGVAESEFARDIESSGLDTGNHNELGRILADIAKTAASDPTQWKPPRWKKFRGPGLERLWEIVSGRYRVLFFPDLERRRLLIVTLFRKKTNSTPRQELDRAVRQMNLYFQALEDGTLMVEEGSS